MSIPNSPIPTNLPPRFEIRRLEPRHAPWANAIVIHANIFSSPVWPAVYPNDEHNSLVARLYKAFTSGNDYLMEHQVASAFSFRVFDKEYEYKRIESRETEGKLYWDVTDLSATRESLLAGMDFPLVSVAMSYDIVNRLDYARMGGMMEALGLYGAVLKRMDELDPRGLLDDWIPREDGAVLQRNATATREDYMGYGLMTKLAQWVMREARRCGWRGIVIECFHDAVTETWMNPPEGLKAEKVCKVNIKDIEEEINGKTVRYKHVDQKATRVFVTLCEE